MATMQEIEALADKMAAVRDALAGVWLAQQDEVRAAMKKYQSRIRKLSADFVAASSALNTAVSESPACFVKPKSIVLHAIQFGYRKGKGKIEWDCEDDTLLARIRRHHPEQTGLLIKTTYEPIKTALADLPAADLKKLGVTVEGTSDVPFVKLTDTDIAKTIKALVKASATEEAEA